MKYGKVNGIERPVSRAVMGTMIFGPEGAAKENTFTLLDEYLKLGGNCIDTAIVYGGGNSEKGIGLWLAERNNRDKVILMDKGCHPTKGIEPRVTPAAVREDVGINLSRLNTPYLDVWMFHRDDPSVPVGPLVEEMNALKAEGKVRVFGASNWSHTRIEEFNEYADKKRLQGFALSSPHLSLAVAKEPMWSGCVMLDDAARAWHAKKQFPLFAWSSQARGFFSGRFGPDKRDGDADVIRVYYNEENFERLRRAEELGKKKGVSAVQIVFAYVMQQPFPTFCLIGPANLGELHSSIAALELTLSPDESRWLNLEK
jgi:aryl-alcohol dehydrogenase-like predicted oxidoreductase